MNNAAHGELRVFYVPLAVVVGLTLVASLFVAFTFIPSLSAKILTIGDGPRGQTPGGSASRAPLYVRFYRTLVGFTLRHPRFAISVALISFGGSFYLFDKHVYRGIIWGGGFGTQETYVDVNINLPRGSDMDRSDALARFFEERIAEMPEVKQFETAVYGERARIRLTFPDSLEQTQAPIAIKEQMVSYSLGFTGAEVRVYGVGPSFGYGGGGGPPNYSITVLGYNYLQVRDIAENLGARLRRMSRIQDVDTNASSSFFSRDKASEFVVEVDRTALARYDMTVQDLTARMRAAIQGARPQQSTIQMGVDEIEFEVKLAGSEMMDAYDLRETVITGPDGTGIRLGDVVTIYERDILARIRRENQQYERTVAYEFRGPRRLGDLVRDRVLETTVVPVGYTVEAAEGWRWSEEERSQIYMVLIISILLIYMVTAGGALRIPQAALVRSPDRANGAHRSLPDLLLHERQLHTGGVHRRHHDGRNRSEQRDPTGGSHQSGQGARRLAAGESHPTGDPRAGAPHSDDHGDDGARTSASSAQERDGRLEHLERAWLCTHRRDALVHLLRADHDPGALPPVGEGGEGTCARTRSSRILNGSVLFGITLFLCLLRCAPTLRFSRSRSAVRVSFGFPTDRRV